MANVWDFDVSADPTKWDPSGFDPYAVARWGGTTYGGDSLNFKPEQVRTKFGFDPNDLSEGGFQKTQDAWIKASSEAEQAIAINSPYLGKRGIEQTSLRGRIAAAATNRNLVWQDYAAAAKQFYNQKSQAVMGDILTQQLRSRQRKIGTDAEEGAAGVKPTGEASVLIGSNIEDPKKPKRTSTSQSAATARSRVSAPGLSI